MAARSASAAALAAALLVPLVPWLVRDASVTGGRLVPMAADGGVALMASVDQYDGVMSEGFADVEVWNAQVARVTGVPAAATRRSGRRWSTSVRGDKFRSTRRKSSAAMTGFKSLSISAP